MGFPIGKVLTFATRALGAIITGVPAVQAMTNMFPSGTGDQKKQAVMDMVRAELAAAELLYGHDLANNPDVMLAVGKVIDAVVAFHTVIAKKADGAADPP